VSANRTSEFLQSVIESRRQAATTEMLCTNVGAFDHQSVIPAEKRQLAAGFNVLVPKGPFVERSNWLMFPAGTSLSGSSGTFRTPAGVSPQSRRPALGSVGKPEVLDNPRWMVTSGPGPSGGLDGPRDPISLSSDAVIQAADGSTSDGVDWG